MSECQQNHHHLLHGVGVLRRRNEEKPPGVGAEGNETKPDQERKPPEISETANLSSNGVFTGRVTANQQRIVHQIVPVVLYGPKGRKKTMAMLDSGSNATLTHQDLAHQLGFSGQTQQLVLSGANANETVESFVIQNLTISGTGRRRNKYTIDKVITVAIRTRLGWFAFATVPSEDGTDVYVRRMEVETAAEPVTHKDFHQQLEQWINMETIPSSRKKSEIRSVEDQKTLDILHTTTRRLPSGDALESGIL